MHQMKFERVLERHPTPGQSFLDACVMGIVDLFDEFAAPGHGERSRSQLLLKLAGAENVLILAVNALAVNDSAVNGALYALYVVSESVLHTPYSVQKCLRLSV